jgi:hypothetical protein
MINDHVIDLYRRVKIGTPVVVVVSAGWWILVNWDRAAAPLTADDAERGDPAPVPPNCASAFFKSAKPDAMTCVPGSRSRS